MARRGQSADEPAVIDHWRQALLPMSEVRVSPPQWVIPRLVVPGLNIMAAPPKTFKSRLVLEMIAAIQEKRPVGGIASMGMVGVKKGMCVYLPAEQKPGTLRHIYETGVLKRKLKDQGIVDWSGIVFAKDPWLWNLSEGKFKLADMIRDLKPLLVVIDPWIHFHNVDENDPRMVQLLLEPKQEVTKYGGALVVVHHTKKAQNGEGVDQMKNDWSRIRGTSALWGMADSGTMLQRVSLKSSAIAVNSEFKEYPPFSWTWRPV